jgi:hypothetical protein
MRQELAELAAKTKMNRPQFPLRTIRACVTQSRRPLPVAFRTGNVVLTSTSDLCYRTTGRTPKGLPCGWCAQRARCDLAGA